MTDAEQPVLTDGVVALRPFDERDIEAHVSGEDDEIRLWFGQPGPSSREGMHDVVERWRRERGAGTRLTFAVEHIHGHHPTVGGDEDPATALRGETYYDFLTTRTPRQALEAWRAGG